MQEIKEIKNKLVDISLIIASIVGLPLLTTSVVRSIDLNFLLFLYFHIGVYLAIVITAIFRKKLKYWFKALTIIVLLFFLATIDLQKTGFQGATYIWLMGAIILSALYFDLKTSMIVLIFSVFLLFYIMALHRLGRINYNIDFNQYLFLPYTIILKLLNITILGLMIAFSIKKVQNNLSRNLTELKQQKEDIERSAKKLSEEVETRKKSEQKAINNEKNFRNIFDQSSEALIIFDVDGSIIDFNDAFLSLTGFTEEEMLKIDINELFVKTLGMGQPPCINESTRSERFNIELTATNGSIKNVDCNKDVIIYNEKPSLLLMLRDVTEKQAREKASFLAALSAEEKERSRFSRELHDGLGPLLSTLKIYLELYEANPSDPDIRKRIEQTLDESIKTVKEISNNLSPYILNNMGLIKAVESFVEKIKFGKKIDIKFSSNLNVRLADEFEISVYRLITELVNNTIKHADASRIDLSITHIENEIIVHFQDNGKGFDINDESLKNKGIGLHNLQSRIRHLGGKIELFSAPGIGFRIQTNLPFIQNSTTKAYAND